MNKKWFLFIEWSLLTLTAMTGIVAAVLFPSTTKYLSSGRDTARISWVSQVTTAVVSYSISNQGQLPPAPLSGCVPANLLTQEMPSFPKDPQWKKSTGCTGNESDFAYRTFTGSDGAPHFLVGVDLESSTYGNSLVPLSELSDPKPYIEGYNPRGVGKYYIIGN